ncbi:hypothetical protein C492_11450 [Natronococcus jeotgali DSM 18795]|uniref:Uncharacterized protein n=1 Tax=Natronococcus jeotgali DSM 18795 TaxID=1227498 RepID=L9XBD2_9EURY|nr:hypothetical protein C492_11450 [Natronococcus jeotgali DSM 18795]
MSVDDIETSRTALKAIYDETIRADGDCIDVQTAEQVVTDATGLEYSQASNTIERLHSVGAINQQSTSDGILVSVTPEGRGEIGLETGSGGSGGKSQHRHLLREVYEWGTRLGYDMQLPTQDGDELPDAVGELPPTVIPDGDLSESERETIVETRLEDDYPEILELSGADTLYIEAESKGLSKPGGPIKNAAKAPDPEQLLFVVGDGGDDGLTNNAERLAAIFGTDDSDRFVSTRTPTDATRKFYTRGKLEMARDRTGIDKLAVVPGDVSTEWVELEGGSVVCRDRADGEVYLRFDGPKDYREREPTDAPSTVHYDPEDGNYVVESDDEVKRRYAAKAPLADDWTHIYEPVIPEAMFREHGQDSVPVPEAFRIAIVPNDDRDLEGDPELLMFDSETEDVIPITGWFGKPSDGTSSTLDGSTGTDGAGPEPKTDHQPTTEPLVDHDPEPAPDPPAPEPPVPGSSTSEPDSENVVEEAASLENEKEDDDDDEPDGSPFRDLNI